MSTKKLQILDSLGFVSYNEQALTDEQKAQTRVNIGAASEADLESVSSLVGDTSVATQVNDALQNSVADWSQTDETAVDYIKNKPDEEDALSLVMELELVSPVTDDDGAIYTDENGALYSL